MSLVARLPFPVGSRAPRAITILGLAALSACGGDGGGGNSGPTPTAPPIAPAPVTPGILSLGLTGLPDGQAADIVVTGTAPSTFSRVATGATSWVDVPPGRYTITLKPVRTATGTFVGAPATQTVDVVAANLASVALSYRAAPSAIALELLDVPAGATPAVTVTPPGGGALAVTASGLLTSPPPAAIAPAAETWKVDAREISAGGTRFLPVPASIDTTLRFGDTARVSVRYTVGSGALAVAVGGLPAGLDGAVVVIAPDGTQQTLSATQTLTGLAAGRYRVVARPVSRAGITWRAQPDTIIADVALSLVAAPASVTYVAQVGRLELDVSGLPSGVEALITLSGAGGSRAITRTVGVDSLPIGSYTITAADVIANGERFAATAASQVVTISTGTSTSATVRYALVPATVDITVTGLPSGVAAAITVVSPNGTSSGITGSTRIAPAAAGLWRLTASPVNTGSAIYQPTPTTWSRTVIPGETLSLPVDYTIATGSLALVVAGIPDGAAGNVTVTGPNGFVRSVNATATLTALAPGSYTVSATSLVANGTTYVPLPATQTVTVAASLVATPATVTYSLGTGAIAVSVNGVPGGSAAAVSVTGANGFTRTLTASGTITAVPVGSYTVTAAAITSGGNSFVGSPASQSVIVVSAGSTATASVTYSQSTGSLALAVLGLPGGTTGVVTITGPGSFSRSLVGTTTLTGLVPGSYTVSASNVSVGGTTYVAAPATQTVFVTTSSTAAPATVTYATSLGALTVTVNGVPGGANGAVTVTGPNAYTRNLTATTALTALTPGSYTVTAASIVAGTTTYAPTPTSQTVNVSASLTATATVTYTAQGGGGGGGGGGTNYSISGVYLTQAIQKPDGSVALVANRDALLRVFVVASAANTARPDVRVRLYDGATLLQTSTVTAPEASVRTSTAEGTLTSTWNLLVPAANMRTTLRVLVDLDPAQAIADADRTDNTWPSSGAPQPITVNSVPTFTVRFVPVVVGALTGNVSAANKEAFLATTRRVWPLQNVVSDVRAPFTSSATELQSGDANNQWLTVLSEMNTLRSTDGAPSTTHYYGVVKVSYSSGIAGYGYQPGRAAIGWDYLPSGDGVAAHEWGHNFSRPHAPCGVSGDPSYPYPNAITNFWGWNSASNTLVSPNATDLMSYCSNNWVSDYNWTAVMNYRATSGLQTSALQAGNGNNGPQDGLLVWGRVVNGSIQLEPAFRVTAPITPAAARPTHRLDLLDAAGSALLQLPIEAALVDHVEGREERQFAVVVPYSAAVADRLEQIRVADQRAPLRSMARRAALPSPALIRENRVRVAAVDSEPGESVVNDGPRVRVSWRNATYGMAMVRDAVTGQILGYVRRPGAAVQTGGRRVEVVFSDGVRSAVKSVR